MRRAATWTARAAALAAVVALLAACHTTRVVWAKPGGDNASLQDDMQACNYQPPATAPAYQAATAAPAYQPLPAPSGYPAGPMTPAHSTPAYSSSGSSGDATNSVTIDVPDAQRSPASCMIAHGWRLTPLP
ncbi:MAG: hypothetical protein ACREED_11440 [Stellaceae bacterium]